MNSAISADKLSRQYGFVQALKNLSFQIKEGECMGLLGPNGAGKSTTIQILTGQLRPTSGSVQIMGIDPVQDPKAVHDIIGYIPDNPSVYEEITVERNIDLFRQIYKEPKEQTKKIIQKVELTDKTKTKVKNLSKGLKQRLLIARTLVHTPKIIFLDEPTSGLDPSSTDFICSILEELKEKGVTLFLCTHLMYLAERLCNRVILLNKGEKREEGTVAELKNKYGGKQAEVKFMEKGQQHTQIIPFDHTFTDRLKQIQQRGELLSVNTNEEKLENIFIRIVRGKR